MTTDRAIWNRVDTTDPAYTKSFKRPGGFTGTSINSTYLVKKASEIFGPMGIGWGVEIIEERIIDGHKIPDSEDCTKIHTIKIKLWYQHGGERGEVVHFGQTPFVYSTKYGVATDEEAPKKSLTDATTKALSMLGFGADIFLGHYDDQNYREEITNTARIKNADEKDLERAKIAEEYQTWRDENLALLSSAQTENEAKILYTLILRKMQRHDDKKGLIMLEKCKTETTARLNKGGE